MDTSAVIKPAPLPAQIPQQKFRPPKKNIPQTRIQRDYLKEVVREYCKNVQPAAPLSQDELKLHAKKILAATELDPIYRDYIGVLINNESWRDQLASIPYDRRLLLLPKCLRVESRCPAPFDEFGLLCKTCGLCSIQDLQAEAERLGYAFLVSEGSAVVMALLETGKIDAVVGVSCLSVLERAFPYVEAAAMPSVAIPLLQDDCIDTNVDLDWVWDVIHLTSDDKTHRLDLTGMRQEVETWFTPESLEKLMGPAEGSVEEIGREWLARAGKRWRPFLAVSVYEALIESPEHSDDLKRMAIAVECFHKASLVHDDIEDEDALRYGEKTLHEEYGVSIALNVGDWLLGEGYRLISELNLPGETRAAMLQVATQGQRRLCQGQGAELAWARHPSPLKSQQTLEIFSRKTSPAFEVALQLGALYAGRDESVAKVLSQYSESLGIAYQIQDDLQDWGEEAESNDVQSIRPSLLLALATEKAKDADLDFIENFWTLGTPSVADVKKVESMFKELGVTERAEYLLESYKEQAIRTLQELNNPSLKGLLRRVIGKIFNDLQIKGWCNEFEARNAASRAASLQSAG